MNLRSVSERYEVSIGPLAETAHKASVEKNVFKRFTLDQMASR